MGVNEIRDGRESLLTERMENIRRVQRREGEAGGGRQFQQLFEFAEREEGTEEEAPATPPPEPPPLPPPPPRAMSPEEVEEAKKRNDTGPGLFIDVEA